MKIQPPRYKVVCLAYKVERYTNDFKESIRIGTDICNRFNCSMREVQIYTYNDTTNLYELK